MAESGDADQPTCFVAMPLTTPINYADKLGDNNHFSHVLDHLFTPALKAIGYRVIAPKSRGAVLIHAEIIKNLEQADLVLCDLSSHNANVFFELGIRTSLDRPVALVKDKMTERIPFDLNAINTHTYDESLAPWTLTNEIDQLAEHVKAVDVSAGSSNDLWRYFGLTKRATPAEITGNPIEAKLDLLLAEITALKAQGATGDGSLHTLSRWLYNILQEATGDESARFTVSRIGDEYIVDTDAEISDGVRREIQRRALGDLRARVRLVVGPRWND